MAKRKASKRKRAAPQRAADTSALPVLDDGETVVGGFSLHDLFQQQTMAMLDRSDLSEEAKQGILIAMNCPCCGAGGLSFTAKLKRRK